jgi:hypothetical protein
VRSPTPVAKLPGNREPPAAVAFPDTGKCVRDLMEKNLLHFVCTGGLAEVAGESYPLLTVDALAKTCLRVVPSKAPLVEPVRGKEFTRS